MRQIVIDWKNFCNGIETFKVDYFYTLFITDLVDETTIEEIEVIYETFPNSEKLVSRMKKYLFDESPNVNEFEKVIILEKLIKHDFYERMPILEQIHSFSKFNSNPKFSYIEDVENLPNIVVEDTLIQDFHDYMRDQIIIDDDKVWELISSLYGLTYDFDYQLFLFQPLLKTNYTMEYLYQFKKLGGVYAITANSIYYSFNKNGL